MSERHPKRLALEVAGDEGKLAELPQSGMLVIGSARDKAGLWVEGQGVAAVHCAIGRTQRGGWAVKDLGSDFGTFVNGARVTQARLEAGDQILVGSRRLRVVDPEAKPPSAPTPPAPPRSAAAPPPEQPPQIPGYRVVRLLGRGAMGSVHLAVQESLAREVALKVLPPRLARDEDFVRRFQAEARAAAALNHPNVVTVHDVGQSDGLHYLTMEYMDRGSLEERVAREGPLHWRAVLDVLHDAASGLVYAESRGIVHRDIKPANLMQNHTGATKIADLGLATNAEAESSDDEAGRKIFGTPHFISPEQVRGQKADARSDLYSLGATAYRLLSGHTPYEGASSREILRAKLREDPRPLRELVPDLPAEVHGLIERLMQRDPELRHPSAAALLREVDALRAGGAPALAAPVAKGGLPARAKVGAALLIALGAAWLVLRPKGEDGGQPRVDSSASGSGGPIVAEAPPEPEEPSATAQATRPDDDARERILELEAENALLLLDQRDLPPAERRDALRQLAERYQGTTVATRALDRAASLEAELRLAERRESERERALGALLRAMDSVAGGAQSAAAGLRALAALEVQAEYAEDPAFLAHRARLEDQILARTLASLETRLEEAAQLERAGRFEELRPELLGILGGTELPALPSGRSTAQTARMLAIRADARAKLDGFEALVQRFGAERERADARAFAEELGGVLGLEDELSRLDLAAAEQRLARLEQRLALPETRAEVSALRADLRAAEAALTKLGKDFGSWRRKGLLDPRARRGGSVEARGAEAGGVLVDGSDGPELLPWSSFGGQSAALHNLFHQRLTRDYTAEELRGIAALLRVSAVVELLGGAARMLEPSASAVFTERDAKAAVALFDDAREWARRAGRTEPIEAEHEAAVLLASALRSASEGAWGEAVKALERLLSEKRSTLLVRLLSDGSGLAGAPPAASPRDPALPETPATPTTQGVDPEGGHGRDPDGDG